MNFELFWAPYSASISRLKPYADLWIKPITVNDGSSSYPTHHAGTVSVLAGNEACQRIIDGQIFPKPIPQGKHSRLQQKLINAINGVTEATQIALALPELRCTFGGRSTVPDIAVFHWHRIAVDDNGDIANTFSLQPDWTIEILSPDQSSTRVTSNILHCLDHGSQLGWLIDPSEQIVQIYDADKRLLSLEAAEDSLVVPDFADALRLTVGQLFAWLQVR